jgi:uncharacterized protein (TIGR02246 family)
MSEARTVRQEIEARNSEFVAAFSRADAAGVAACYTEDATLLPPGGALTSGRKAIQQFWQGALDMGLRVATLRTQQAEASGDLAYEVGEASLKIPSADGSVSNATVRYVVVWKRQSGGPWQLAVDIWNSDATG